MQQIIEQLYRGGTFPGEESEVKVSEYGVAFNNAVKAEFKFRD